MYDGTTRGTFGSSGEMSRRLDEFQFTFGEGPCLDAVRDGAPVLVANFNDPAEGRWPPHGMTATDVAWAVVERRILLDTDGLREDPGSGREPDE